MFQQRTALGSYLVSWDGFDFNPILRWWYVVALSILRKLHCDFFEFKYGFDLSLFLHFPVLIPILHWYFDIALFIYVKLV